MYNYMQVMNTNSMSTTAVGLIGYLPFIEVINNIKIINQHEHMYYR